MARPRLPDSKRVVLHGIGLTPALRDYCLHIGEGNLSGGVRLAIKRAQHWQRAKDGSGPPILPYGDESPDDQTPGQAQAPCAHKGGIVNGYCVDCEANVPVLGNTIDW